MKITIFIVNHGKWKIYLYRYKNVIGLKYNYLLFLEDFYYFIWQYILKLYINLFKKKKKNWIPRERRKFMINVWFDFSLEFIVFFNISMNTTN